jgi:hypothetical protein
MQIVPRYLVSNKSVVVANEAGFVTEYRPVYQKHIQIYKGIDNVLEFKVLNADQKPIDLIGYTPMFVAFDETNNMVIEHSGSILQDSTAFKGIFSVTVSDNDLLNIKEQYLKYSIYLKDSNNDSVITYTDTHFGMNGIIHVSNEAMPGPRDTFNLETFLKVAEDDPFWTSEALNAGPGINGNEALHTAAVYTDSYIGDVIVQATLDNQVTNQTQWADVATLTFTGLETTPEPVNFNGVFSHLRFKATANPADKITKILVRN